MNNKKLLLVSTLLVIQYISGCGSDANGQANQTEGFSETPIGFEELRNYQTDIFYQRTEIINDIDAYNNIFLYYPSLTSIPEFTQEAETLIVILAPAPSCGYHYEAEAVTENETTVNAYMVQVPVPDQPACDPLPFPIYGFNVISIPKTDKLVNVVF